MGRYMKQGKRLVCPQWRSISDRRNALAQATDPYWQGDRPTRLCRSDRLRSRVVLEIGTPRKLGRGWDWACPVRIVGLDDCPKSPEPIFGIDAVQALECAMHYARGTLSKVSPSLT